MKANLIIVAAPSGAGKSSFVERICREEPRLVDTVTYTTRSMRRGESQGHPYHFVSKSEFEALIDRNFFVEWAFVHNNMYGTPLNQLEEAWKSGKAVIMDVDIQGAATFRAKFPDQAAGIFILPPSLDELERRIVKRDGQRPSDLDVRLKNAQIETAKAHEFDYQVVNDDFERSYAEFKKIVEDLLKPR
ncbi:MAG: guanylate kinase [Bdellovibrionaceae bacterium]|nr:guanylate kinase [Pseudobdellovibrionaceae bacterium]